MRQVGMEMSAAGVHVGGDGVVLTPMSLSQPSGAGGEGQDTTTGEQHRVHPASSTAEVMSRNSNKCRAVSSVGYASVSSVLMSLSQPSGAGERGRRCPRSQLTRGITEAAKVYDCLHSNVPRDPECLLDALLRVYSSLAPGPGGLG